MLFGFEMSLGHQKHSHTIYVLMLLLWRFSDVILATILATKSDMCGKKFELKIDNIRFVGHPTLLQHAFGQVRHRSRTPLQQLKLRGSFQLLLNFYSCPFPSLELPAESESCAKGRPTARISNPNTASHIPCWSWCLERVHFSSFCGQSSLWKILPSVVKWDSILGVFGFWVLCFWTHITLRSH